jgi:hypothetical protein
MSRSKWDKTALCSQHSNVKLLKTSSLASFSKPIGMVTGTKSESTRTTSYRPWIPRHLISFRIWSTRISRKQLSPWSKSTSRKRRARTRSRLMTRQPWPVTVWTSSSFPLVSLNNKNRSSSLDPTYRIWSPSSRQGPYPKLRMNTQNSSRRINN